MTAAIDAAPRLGARRRASYFYFYMAIACAVVAFLGFAPTYWLPLAGGSLKARPIVHLHGLVFFAWTLFFVAQTWLAASGRLARHRALGMIGIALATAMTMLGAMVAIVLMQNSAAAGFAEAGKAFAIVPLGGISFFAIAVALAIANVARPERHKRLLLVASISILDAAIARWFLTFLAPPGAQGPPPVEVAVGPALVASLLLAYALVADWRLRGRPHPIYVVGLVAYVGMKLVQVPLSATAAWQGAAGALLALAT